MILSLPDEFLGEIAISRENGRGQNQQEEEQIS